MKAQLYDRLFGNHPLLEKYQQAELEFIRTYAGRNLIHLGAGYGRVVVQLASFADHLTVVEIDDEMFESLRRRSEDLENVDAVHADMMSVEIPDNTTVLLLQNTLSILIGDVESLKTRLKGHDVILSLCRGEALADWGREVYAFTKELTGTLDAEKSDLENGLFVTKNGYRSRWFFKDEIDAFIEGLGVVADEVVTDHYRLIHIKACS